MADSWRVVFDPDDAKRAVLTRALAGDSPQAMLEVSVPRGMPHTVHRLGRLIAELLNTYERVQAKQR